jgi:HAD superfamily hydrolase (TIGR01484 family)
LHDCLARASNVVPAEGVVATACRNQRMSLPIRIVSTDFDGTLHADHENPPVPIRLQKLLGELQRQGVAWVINTGRDLSSLMEGLGRAQLSVWPDYMVVVEREIYVREGHQYLSVAEWNDACTAAHQELFGSIRADIPRLKEWANTRFDATIYEDAWSPFCLIARNNGDADAIHRYLEDYCATVPDLTVVRNDVYARFSHAAYNKGTALSEVARRLGASVSQIVAAGDHLNDLPMLSTQHAGWLISPANAIAVVKEKVLGQKGYVSTLSQGHGVADGLERILAGAGELPGPVGTAAVSR